MEGGYPSSLRPASLKSSSCVLMRGLLGLELGASLPDSGREALVERVDLFDFAIELVVAR